MDYNFTGVTPEYVDINNDIYANYQGYMPVFLSLVMQGNITTIATADFEQETHTTHEVLLGDDATDADLAKVLNGVDTELMQLTPTTVTNKFNVFFAMSEIRGPKRIFTPSLDNVTISELNVTQDRWALNGFGGNAGIVDLATAIVNTDNDFATAEKVVQAVVGIINETIDNTSLADDQASSVAVVIPNKYYKMLLQPVAFGNTTTTGLALIRMSYPDAQLTPVKAGVLKPEYVDTIFGVAKPFIGLTGTLPAAVIEDASERYSRMGRGRLYGLGSVGFKSLSPKDKVVMSIKKAAA